jgi:hypothetical protein
MREFGGTFRGFAKGLRPDDHIARNNEYLSEAYNCRCGKKGLEPYTALTNAYSGVSGTRATATYRPALAADTVRYSVDQDSNKTFATDQGKIGYFDYATPWYKYHSAILFKNVVIDQGASISMSYISLESAISGGGDGSTTADVKVYAYDADNVTAAPTDTGEFDTVLAGKTTASANMPIENDWSDADEDWHNSDSINTVIQEIVDRPGWVSGNNILIILEAEFTSPNLFVTFTAGTGSTRAKLIIGEDTEKWKYPQTFITNTHRIVMCENVANTADASWTVTEQVDELTAGTRWDIADFGRYVLLTNGQQYVYTSINISDVLSWTSASSLTATPLCKCIDNFKGQLIGGNVQGSWHSCGEGHLIWSNIGDISCTPNKQNEAGFTKIPWEGEVFRVARCGDFWIAYCENGVLKMTPVATPVATFKMEEKMEIGLLTRDCFAGGYFHHCFIDAHKNVWVWDKGREPERLGYSEYIETLTAADIIIEYDKLREEYYITDGANGCFLLSSFGMTEVYQYPSTVFAAGTTTYGQIYDASSNTYFLATTDVLDNNLRAFKHIEAVGVGGQNTATMQVAVDWKNDTRTATYTRSAWKQINETGFAYPGVTAVDYRIAVYAAAFANVYLDYISTRIKLVDKRAIRGAYSAGGMKQGGASAIGQDEQGAGN